MNDLMTAKNIRRRHRLTLLTSVSAAALVTVAYGAQAADAARPEFWLELGWQYENEIGNADVLDPTFAHTTAWVGDGFFAPAAVQRLNLWSYGANAALSFQPEDSDWAFRLSARYGRAHGRKGIASQLPSATYVFPTPGAYVAKARPKFARAEASAQQTHAIIDFVAEKDVGLGLFGKQGTSTAGIGLRFAQFRSRTAALVSADPDSRIEDSVVHVWYLTHPLTLPNLKYYHLYKDSMTATREFHGIGPTISWNASAALAGNTDDGELTLDWGLNAALLFGRQKANVNLQTITDYYHGSLHNGGYNIQRPRHHEHYQTSPSPRRSRSVLVPNIGGFAGFSYRFDNAKISVGYRADLFLNAFDGGIDVRHDITRSFNGPFASISFGISPSDF